MPEPRDSVDRHVETWTPELPWMDPVHEALTARLMLISKHLQRARSTTFASDDLTLASFKVLLTLCRLGPPYTASPTRLSELLGLSKGALSARLAPLEADGLIARRTDADDRRRVHVTLTKAGRTAFDAHGRDEGDSERATWDALNRADQERLSDLLRTVVIAIESRR